MSTTSNKSPATTIDRLGGEPVIIKVTWTSAEQKAQSFFKPGDLFKMVVKKESTLIPGTYVDIGESGAELFCYSGVPGTPEVIEYRDPPQTAIGRFDVVETAPSSGVYVNAPAYQTVTGYMPKLNVGVYWIQLQRLVTGTYVDYGNPVSMWCVEPLRDEIVYSLKSNFPPSGHPYLVGAQDISEGTV